MKLKEKLARDYLNLNNDGPEFWAYLAGFEKAREMASQAHLKSPEPFHYIEHELGEEEVTN